MGPVLGLNVRRATGPCIRAFRTLFPDASPTTAHGSKARHRLGIACPHVPPVSRFTAVSSTAGNFSWSDVLVVGADVGLGEHSKSGWGYVGEEGDWKRTSLAKRAGRVFVDNHRLLPDQDQASPQTPLNLHHTSIPNNCIPPCVSLLLHLRKPLSQDTLHLCAVSASAGCPANRGRGAPGGAGGAGGPPEAVWVLFFLPIRNGLVRAGEKVSSSIRWERKGFVGAAERSHRYTWAAADGKSSSRKMSIGEHHSLTESLGRAALPFLPAPSLSSLERRRRASCDMDAVGPDLPPISEAARDASADARRRAFRISVTGGDPVEMPRGARATQPRAKGRPQWASARGAWTGKGTGKGQPGALHKKGVDTAADDTKKGEEMGGKVGHDAGATVAGNGEANTQGRNVASVATGTGEVPGAEYPAGSGVDVPGGTANPPGEAAARGEGEDAGGTSPPAAAAQQ